VPEILTASISILLNSGARRWVQDFIQELRRGLREGGEIERFLKLLKELPERYPELSFNL